jgi:hypothetical protein
MSFWDWSWGFWDGIIAKVRDYSFVASMRNRTWFVLRYRDYLRRLAFCAHEIWRRYKSFWKFRVRN